MGRVEPPALHGLAQALGLGLWQSAPHAGFWRADLFAAQGMRAPHGLRSWQESLGALVLQALISVGLLG